MRLARYLSCVAAVLLTFQNASSLPQVSAAGSATEAMYRAAAASAESKFQQIERNGSQAYPDRTPTVITEREINAYLASGKVKLPAGVSQLRLAGRAGIATADATVDFDKVTEGKRSSHPLLRLFSGRHQVTVECQAQGASGVGRVHINSAAIDGITVPRIALEYFASKYIQPKHPNLGVDSEFRLPDRIDNAAIGDHSLIVIQK